MGALELRRSSELDKNERILGFCVRMYIKVSSIFMKNNKHEHSLDDNVEEKDEWVDTIILKLLVQPNLRGMNIKPTTILTFVGMKKLQVNC